MYVLYVGYVITPCPFEEASSTHPAAQKAKKQQQKSSRQNKKEIHQ
jgi:hypothetical protein